MEENVPCVFKINQSKNHVTVLGIVPEKDKIQTPALMHFPDMGSFQIRSHHDPRWGGHTSDELNDGWQHYENGRTSGNYVYFTLSTLYKMGRKSDAEKILFPLWITIGDSWQWLLVVSLYLTNTIFPDKADTPDCNR